MIIARTAAVFAATLTAACATGPRWVPAGEYTPPSSKYSVRFPEGWMRASDQDSVLASRDGILLQHIRVRVVETGKPLGGTRKTLSRGMLPQEVAEVVRDGIASARGMQGMTLIENVPAELAGHPGFKLVLAYKDADGLKMKAVVYGALIGDSLYEVTYRAPERHYFERDLAALERVRGSLKVAELGAFPAKQSN
jgi:hypothetical protein